MVCNERINVSINKSSVSEIAIRLNFYLRGQLLLELRKAKDFTFQKKRLEEIELKVNRMIDMHISLADCSKWVFAIDSKYNSMEDDLMSHRLRK